MGDMPMKDIQELVYQYEQLSSSEKKQFRKEAKLKKRGSKAPLILFLLVIALAAGGWFGLLPHMYDTAVGMMENKQWDEAIAVFNRINFYSDCKEKIADCNAKKELERQQAAYDAAAAQLQEGKYDEAVSGFMALGEYADAAAQVEAARTAKKQAAYDAAAAMLKEEKYDESIAAFTALGDFSDAAAQAEAAGIAKNQAAYEAAVALLNEGKYDEAIDAFAALGDFSDAAAQVDVARYAKNQAAYDAATALLNEGKYDEAIEAFTALGSFADAARQVNAAEEAKKQAAYSAAAVLLLEGKYDEAIAAFTELGDFSDAAAQVKAAEMAKTEAQYQEALKLFEEGAYRTAAEKFDALTGYKDSADYAAKAKESFPNATLDTTSVNTAVGQKVTVTGKVNCIDSIDKLTIEPTEAASTTYTISGNQLIMTKVYYAEVKECTLEDGLLTINLEGGITTGNTTIQVKDKDGVVLAEVAVNNTGLTDAQKTNIGKVQTLSDLNFFFYDDVDQYVLNFSLKDANNTRISACCTVDLRIVNNNGKTVYEGHHFLTEKDFGIWTSSLHGERLQAGLYLKPEDILEGDTTGGTVYAIIKMPGGGEFSEIKTSTSDLPIHDATEDCALDVPATPVTTSYYNRTTVKITDIAYTFSARSNGNVDLKISFAGIKTYDRDGNNHSEAGRIGYKLYDPEGYVAKSGSVSTTDVAVNERFRDATLNFYDLTPGTYRLVLLDVN